MKFWGLLSLASLAVASKTAPSSLDTKNSKSIKDVSGTLAFDTMTYYRGNVSSVPKDMGDLQDPYYWWVAGALWGVMLDYYHLTGDYTYNDVVIEALLAPTNLGPNHDYVPAEHADEEGNDDLFFWGQAALSAAERNFPQPDHNLPSWLQIGINVFDSLASRWDPTTCGGGLRWQIYPDNPNGMTYKNTVTNGGFFQLAARLARITGEQKYLDWANKVWDWSWEYNLIDHDNYHVSDGADIRDNCQQRSESTYTYTAGIYLYGAAVLANHTGKAEWAERSRRLVESTAWFFHPQSNPGLILYEGACEPVNLCSPDASTHKGFLARFMYLAVQMQPALKGFVHQRMLPTSKAAAQSCVGGKTGRECGLRWWMSGFDGETGLGQQMCALETIQGLLLEDAPAPLQGKDVKVVRSTDWAALARDKVSAKSTPTSTSTSTSISSETGTGTSSEESAKPSKSEGAADHFQADLVLASFSVGSVLLFLGLA